MKVVVRNADSRTHGFDIVAFGDMGTVRFPEDMLGGRILLGGQEKTLDLPVDDCERLSLRTDQTKMISMRVVLE